VKERLSMSSQDQVPAAQSAPDVSVIICAHTEDRWSDLLAAIASVQGQHLPARELIVVIDYNPVLLARVQAAVDGATVIPNAGRRGLSGARNTGVEAATGAVVAFLDDDAVAHPDWVKWLVAGYLIDGHNDHRILGVGGTITPLWAGGRPGWFPEEFDWVVGCTYRGMATTAAPVRNLIGCNMSFRREVFTAIGGFRSEFGRLGATLNSCEETEFCIRARQRFQGGYFLHQPPASVEHRVPAGRGRFSYFRARCYAEGRSKALVARVVGSDDALSSERVYTFQTLPRGVVRGLADTVATRNRHGAARAGAIVAGFAVTAAGYIVGQAGPRLSPVVRLRSRVNRVRGARQISQPAEAPVVSLLPQ
jgi:GT2 family glycosyltransferase